MKADLAGAFARAWRPLAWYYTIAVAVPVLNGATLDRGFLEHAAFVLAVPVVIVLAGGALRAASPRTRDRPAEPTEPPPAPRRPS